MGEDHITSMAIAASSKYLLEHIETTVGVTAAFERAPEAACRLLAAGAYYMGRMLAPKGTSDEQILKDLEGSEVEVKVNKDGKTIRIDNLHFYLTANTVQQLNTNPKEVINNYLKALEPLDRFQVLGSKFQVLELESKPDNIEL